MHTKLQAKLLLDSTLENMDNHQLSPTPDNYRLWFEYASGSIDQLNADIDSQISQQTGISQAICQQLFIKYIANKDQSDLDETRIAMGEMLSVMVKHLKDWDSSSTNFCDSMGSCLSKLDGNPSIEDVKAVIAKVTEEAKNIRAANFSIKATLHTLTDEISSLRQDVNRLGNEATTDALTETINRRGFDSQLKEITQKALEKGFDCSLIVADVDNFKKINDNFGHQVGDKILKYIAATLRKNIRGGDVLARYGGEEFAIILPHTSFEGAMVVAENIRQAISARQLTTGANGKIIGRITISVGVTTYKAEESMNAFFERADRFMYKAKNNGKDQVFGAGSQASAEA
jgi:diguanylate cyclase